MNITVTLTTKELVALDFCLFTLELLADYEDQLEDLHTGFQSLALTAVEKGGLLRNAVWQTAKYSPSNRNHHGYGRPNGAKAV